MATKEELACVYAALILHDDKIAITKDAIQAILTAANVKVPAYLPVLFAKMLANKNIEDLLFSGGAVAAPAPVAAAASSEPSHKDDKKKGDDKKKKEEEKKKVEEEEEQDLGGLFDFCLMLQISFIIFHFLKSFLILKNNITFFERRANISF
ncbi:putative large subunit ribosomal protein LP1 [Monocercomonoides exilis]|uniref:putative large subunit ribosomal protein LP1 n=2 Tax=Monocercomonoides exilis TaxID=2049356 RepID=UPI003559C0F4|nr:putative large subunit ribosomal protein LP1 [Monocercomonoides exilis]